MTGLKQNINVVSMKQIILSWALEHHTHIHIKRLYYDPFVRSIEMCDFVSTRDTLYYKQSNAFL